MRRNLAFLLFVLLAVIATALDVVEAKTIIQPRKKILYLNKDCKKNGTCDLVKVEYRVEDFTQVSKWGKEYGTRIFVSYTTKKVADLTEYVIVQFIEGCMFKTERMTYGDILARHTIGRHYFNGYQIFVHPHWQIDSIDDNPVYFSVKGKPLHYCYRWNTKSGSTEKKTERLYGKTKPSRPTLYVFGHLGPAGNKGNEAGNISLRIRTCLYKTADVPKIARPDEIDFGTPIHCYEWDSSYIYNFKKGKYEKTKEISSACDYCGEITLVFDNPPELEIIDTPKIEEQQSKETN